jgi:osmotically-inducible protein OsmY
LLFILCATLFSNAAFMSASEVPLESAADAIITTEVKGALLFNLLLSSNTKTCDGVVTLSGRVDTTAEKVLGTSLATGISGVKRVINNMVISTAQTANN